MNPETSPENSLPQGVQAIVDLASLCLRINTIPLDKRQQIVDGYFGVSKDTGIYRQTLKFFMEPGFETISEYIEMLSPLDIEGTDALVQATLEIGKLFPTQQK